MLSTDTTKKHSSSTSSVLCVQFAVHFACIDLDRVSNETHTPSLFSICISSDVPPWLSMMSAIIVCKGVEQRLSAQYRIMHIIKKQRSLLV